MRLSTRLRLRTDKPGKCDQAFSRSCICIATLIAICPAFSTAEPTTSAPAKYNHEALLKKVRETPIQVPPTLSRDGKPLTSEQSARMEQAAKQMADAKEARLGGEYARASGLAEQALKTRAEIVGDKHYLTVTARVLAATLKEWAGVSKERQEKLREADKKIEESTSFYEAGKYAESQAAARSALAIREKQMTMDDVEIGKALHAIGSADVDLGLLEEAEFTLLKALEIFTNTYGEQHPTTAKTLDRLGWLSIYLAGREGFRGSQPRKSVDYFNRAVKALMATVGETAETAESLDNRGTAQKYVENYDEALNDKLRGLFIRETLLGRNAKDTAVSISNLAWLYGELGDRDKVLPFRREALEIFDRVLPPEHPYRLLEKGNLARDCVRMGRLDEAIGHFEDIAKADARLDDPLNIGALDRMAEFGAILIRAKRHDDGIRKFDTVFERSKKLREAGKGADARNILYGVARGCQGHRLLKASVKYHQQLVEWDDADRGREDAPEYVTRLSSLGALQLELGEVSAAERTLKKAIERIRRLSGDTSFDLVSPLLNLARAKTLTNDLDKAEDACEEALQIAETRMGRQSVATAFAMMSLGRVNALQKRFAEAEFNLVEAQSLFKLFEDHDPTGTIRATQELADCHRLKGDHAKAIELLRPTLEQTRTWAAEVDNDFGVATLAETLHYLLEATEGDKALEKERQAWKTELKTLLESLESRHTINHREQEWKKDLG